jgi:hypothetical protein
LTRLADNARPMSVDLLSLGLAAAMPVGVFLLYLWARSRLEGRGRHPSRPRRVETPRKVDSGPSWPAPVQVTATSQPRRAETPLTPSPPPISSQMRAAEPPLRLSPLPPLAAPRGTQPAMTVDRPITVAHPVSVAQPVTVAPPISAESPHPVLAKLPSSRPSLHPAGGTSPDVLATATMAAPATESDRGPRNGRSVGTLTNRGPLSDQPAALSAGPFQAHPIAPTAPLARDDDVPDRGPNRGRFSATLRPIRTVLGRLGRDSDAAEPHWPAPEQPDPAFRLYEYFEESREPCPACAEWYEKGARFCRRCGRPVDARSRSAASAAGLAAIPLTAPTAATADSAAVAGAAAGYTLPAGPPSIAQPPVVHPARYIPAALPVMAAGTAPGPSRAIAIGTVTPAGVAVGPGAPIRSGTSVNGAAAPAKGAAARNGKGAVIDLNHASIAQLSTLHGVGPATARRIVDARKERAFDTVETLAERKLVTRSVLEKLKDQVTVAPSAD